MRREHGPRGGERGGDVQGFNAQTRSPVVVPSSRATACRRASLHLRGGAPRPLPLTWSAVRRFDGYTSPDASTVNVRCSGWAPVAFSASAVTRAATNLPRVAPHPGGGDRRVKRRRPLAWEGGTLVASPRTTHDAEASMIETRRMGGAEVQRNGREGHGGRCWCVAPNPCHWRQRGHSDATCG